MQRWCLIFWALYPLVGRCYFANGLLAAALFEFLLTTTRARIIAPNLGSGPHDRSQCMVVVIAMRTMDVAMILMSINGLVIVYNKGFLGGGC